MDDSKQIRKYKLENQHDSQTGTQKPTIEMLSQFDAEATPIVPKTIEEQRRKLKSRPKQTVLSILAIGALILTLIYGAVWFALTTESFKNNTNENVAGKTSEEGNGQNEPSIDKSIPKDEVIELSVDNELVRKLYGYFDDLPWDIPFVDISTRNVTFYLGNFVTDEQMLAIAMLNNVIPHENGNSYPEECTVSDLDIQWPREVFENGGTISPFCQRGEKLRKLIKEIFGKEINFEKFRNESTGEIRMQLGSSLYTYSAMHDAFLQTGGRGGTWKSLLRSIYYAERNAERLYLYETAVVTGFISDETDTERIEYMNLKGETLWTSDKLTLTEENLVNYKDMLECFKWTFARNGENYIFEKLERI